MTNVAHASAKKRKRAPTLMCGNRGMNEIVATTIAAKAIATCDVEVDAAACGVVVEADATT